MRKGLSLTLSAATVLSSSFLFAMSSAFATDNSLSNPMQEQTVGGGYQQRAAAATAPAHAAARDWAPKTFVTCTRGRVQIKLTNKNAACPPGYVRS
jgi:hypothetical protein